jgi:hypothetical protein
MEMARNEERPRRAWKNITFQSAKTNFPQVEKSYKSSGISSKKTFSTFVIDHGGVTATGDKNGLAKQ